MHHYIKYLIGIIATTCSFNTFSNETTTDQQPTAILLEANNGWNVEISNSAKLKNPIYVTIRNAGNYWEVAGLFDRPPKIPRTQNLEVFAVTRDFQRWTNMYVDMRTDCDTFEAQEDDFQSVCTSGLAEKKTGLGVAGLFFGGSGKTPFAYTDEKVKSAINSIRPQQALEFLTAFEKGSLIENNRASELALNQEKEQRDAYEAQAKNRKKAPIGAKDWCEQTVKYQGIILQINSTYTCQNYGVVTEEILSSEGWSITNKQKRRIEYGQVFTVYDLAIEKVPR